MPSGNPPDSGQAHATVTTLTAEVRTLVIGARQVTLSVFNQLDSVDYTAIEPFGRVSPRGAAWHELHVVGRATRGVSVGALVRSWVPTSEAMIMLEADQFVPGGFSIKWRQLNEHGRDELDALVDDWTDLPLIVLAGLR